MKTSRIPRPILCTLINLSNTIYFLLPNYKVYSNVCPGVEFVFVQKYLDLQKSKK